MHDGGSPVIGLGDLMVVLGLGGMLGGSPVIGLGDLMVGLGDLVIRLPVFLFSFFSVPPSSSCFALFYRKIGSSVQFFRHVL